MDIDLGWARLQQAGHFSVLRPSIGELFRTVPSQSAWTEQNLNICIIGLDRVRV